MTMVMIAQPKPGPAARADAAPPMRAMPARKPLPPRRLAEPQAITVPVRPPETAAPAAPAVPSHAPIDLDAAVKAAGRMDLDGDTPSAQVRKRQQLHLTTSEQLGQDIGKAGRADCLRAHADKGLLAPLFIVSDKLTDRGCK